MAICPDSTYVTNCDEAEEVQPQCTLEDPSIPGVSLPFPIGSNAPGCFDGQWDLIPLSTEMARRSS